jgi:hypothetical protein
MIGNFRVMLIFDINEVVVTLVTFKTPILDLSYLNSAIYRVERIYLFI